MLESLLRPTDSAGFKLVAHLQGHTDHISDLKWSPDGHRLLTCSHDGSLIVWNASTSAARFRRGDSSDGPRTTVAWSPNAKYFACGLNSGVVEIRDSQTAKELARLTKTRRRVKDLAWAPGSTTLAFGGADRTVYFCHLSETASLEVSLAQLGIDHMYSIESMCWSPDGSQLVTGTAGGTLGIWSDLQIDNQLRDALSTEEGWPHNDAVTSLAWEPKSNTLASSSGDKSIKLWRVQHRDHIATLDIQEPVSHVQWALDGQVLVVQTNERVTFLVEEAEVGSLPCISDELPIRFAMDPQNSRIATVDIADHSIRIFELDLKALVRSSRLTYTTYTVGGASVLGRAQAGKSSVIRALSGKTFEKSSKPHGLEVTHTARSVQQKNSAEHVRDIALWDMPNYSDCRILQSLEAYHFSTCLVVLEPRPGESFSASIPQWHAEVLHYRRAWGAGGCPVRR